MKNHILKKLVYIPLLSMMTLTQAHANDFACIGDIERDLKDHVERQDEAARLLVLPAKLCLGIENLYPRENEIGDKITSVAFGCALAGVIYGTLPISMSGTLGAPAAIGGWAVSGMLGYQKRFSFDQIALNTYIHRYYTEDNKEEILQLIQDSFFRTSKINKTRFYRYSASLEQIEKFLDDNRNTNTLCANPGKTTQHLKITEEGLRYLEKLDLVPMDLILNDEVSDEVKRYVQNNFLYLEYETLGTSITDNQFRDAVKNIK